MSNQNDLFSNRDAEDAPNIGRVFKIETLFPCDLKPLSLFQGYRRLRCITYSYSLPFIAQLVDQFDEIEVIIGSPKTLTASKIAGAIHIPSVELEIQEETELINAIERSRGVYPKLFDKVSFRIMIGKPSHEKLFLLDGDNGHRVILGSGNLSAAAIKEQQYEIFMYADGQDNFGQFEPIYNFSCKQSEPPLIKHTRVDDGSTYNRDIKPNELPLVQHLQQANLVISEQGPEIERALRYVAPSLQKERPKTLKFEQVVKRVEKFFAKPGVKKEDVAFEPIAFDFENKQIRKGDQIIHQNDVLESDLTSDIAIIRSWFEHYQEANFTGDKSSAIRGFEILLTFTMVSPFLSSLNHVASREMGAGYLYPLFAVMFGPASGGKTSFIEMLRPLAMRSAYELKGLKFSPSQVEKFQVGSHMGLLIMDDIKNQAIKMYLDQIVKKDEAAKTDIFAPCIVTTNKEVYSLESSALKRILPIWIDASTDVKSVERRPSLGVALFRSFLEVAYPIYERHLQQPSDQFLPEVSMLWSKFGLDIAPITTQELKQREIVPIRRQLSTIISEKKRTKNIQRQGEDVVITFSNSDEAKALLNDLPVRLQARVGENTMWLNIKGLRELGLDTGDSGWFSRLWGL